MQERKTERVIPFLPSPMWIGGSGMGASVAIGAILSHSRMGGGLFLPDIKSDLIGSTQGMGKSFIGWRGVTYEPSYDLPENPIYQSHKIIPEKNELEKYSRMINYLVMAKK